MRVLIVEDDKATAIGIGHYLKEEEISFALISNGVDAIPYAHQAQGFDAIMLDLTLPDMSGYEVIEKIRAKSCRIPILVLTDDASIESTVKALGLGADDYMTKPFHKDELVARLHAIVRGRKFGQEQALEVAVKLSRSS